MTEIRADVCDHLAALAVAIPTEAAPETGVDHLILNDLKLQAAEERTELAEQLRLAWHEDDIDPVLAQIADARAEILAAEQRMRLTIAYARKFAYPRPYRLEDLAIAAGMSISGVRTAYDDDEVEQVAAATGLHPREHGGTR